MAKPSIHLNNLTNETINGNASYRVRLAFGTFSVYVKGGLYHYVVKRHRGELYKVYLGKAGDIDKEDVLDACKETLHKCYSASGEWYLESVGE